MSKENVTASAPVHQLVGRIRDLLTRATPGPWFYDLNGDKCRVFSAWIPPGKYARIAPVVCETMPWTGDQAKQGPGNAELIVAAINALPALLAVAEAAHARMETHDTGEDYTLRNGSKEWDNLRAALALLPNAQGQPAATEPAKQDRRGPLGCADVLGAEHLPEKSNG